jgi:hypothetical protein
MRNVFTIPDDLDQLARLDAYPGVSPEETRPLRAFLKRYAAHHFTEVRFNVRTGVGESAPAGADPALKRAIEEGTRLRIDCVGFRGPNESTLIEAKVSLGNDGVWQLLGYRDAYVREHPSDVLRLVLVAERSTSTASNLAQSYGIGLYLYTFETDSVDVLAPATEANPSGI